MKNNTYYDPSNIWYDIVDLNTLLRYNMVVDIQYLISDMSFIVYNQGMYITYNNVYLEYLKWKMIN